MNARLTGIRRNLAYIALPEDGGEGQNGGGTPPATAAWTPPASQADLDRILNSAVARAHAKYADYDTLKEKAAKFDQAATSATRDDLQTQLDNARAEGAKSVTEKTNSRLIEAEARALAAEAKFRNPTLATKALDLSQVIVGDDGAVDAASIRQQLTTLATTEPYLIEDGSTPKPKPDPGQGSGASGKAGGVSAGRELYKPRSTST